MAKTDPNASCGRRRLLRVAATGIAGLTLASAADSVTAREESSVTFEDQTTDGREIVIREVDAAVDVMYTVATDGHEQTFARGELSAGERENVTVSLDTPLTEGRLLELSLYPSGGGSVLVTDSATVTPTGNVEYRDGIPVTRVDADPDAGFEYPYYLYAPSRAESDRDPPILVEPNNTGTSTDEFGEHESAVERRMDGGLTRRLADRIGVPLLMPVFPRPRSDPVDWRHYTHQLDRETIQIDGGPLERIDRQLLRMVEDATRRLADASYPVRERIALNGFSASGNFVDRFAVLHPDRVLSVTAGGLNGMTLLPLSEAEGRTLNYHVGIADVEEFTGKPVDLDALGEVNQLLYMGSEDDNDTIPYEDAWTDDELRQTALEVYGDDMIEERFPFCQSAYEEAGVSAQFRVYDGAGHTPRPAVDDIVEFHRRSIEGEDVGAFGQQLGLNAQIERSTTTPAVGETVEFDGSASQLDRGEIVAYTWEFGDGETASGAVVTHAFDAAGSHTVTLTTVDDSGRTDEAAVEVEVGDDTAVSDDADTGGDAASGSGAESGGADAGTETDGGSDAVASTDSTSDGTQSNADGAEPIGISAPGFGVGPALAGIAGASYALRRRLNDGESR
ncbi:PKD domain-containing protein [Halobellus sp. GM3]|uniref:PKD domain-containing protein n=1 Tax=Halobellus sp. GM3 TaxID=3458410 RepID=UPI00403D79AA